LKLKNRKLETLISLIKKYVLLGSIINTNCWKGYCNLHKESYIHCTVNHSINFVENATGVRTNTIKETRAAVKMNVAMRYCNKRDTSYFLELFAFKRNNEFKVFKKLF